MIFQIKRLNQDASMLYQSLKLHEKDVGSHILQLFNLGLHIRHVSEHTLKFKKDKHAMKHLQELISKYRKTIKYTKIHHLEQTEKVLNFFK